MVQLPVFNDWVYISKEKSFIVLHYIQCRSVYFANYPKHEMVYLPEILFVHDQTTQNTREGEGGVSALSEWGC